MTNNTTTPDSLQPAAETAVDLFDNWFDPIEAEVRARSRQFIEELLRGELGSMDGGTPGRDSEVTAFADLRGFAKWNDEVFAREWIHRVALSKEVLVLEEEHGILAKQRGPEHAGYVTCPAREHHDQPRNVREDRLAAL